MFQYLRKIPREDWLLYILFIMTTFGRHVEPFAIIGWMLCKGQLGNSFNAMFKLMPIFVYIVISSIIGFVMTQFPMDMFFEQTAQLIVYMSIYYAFMLYYRGKYEHVFEIYCNVAFIMAICGILQYILGRLVGIQFLQGLTGREVYIGDLMRAQAWMGEPSYFALYLVPAIVYTSMKKGIENLRGLIMMGAALLTFSPVFKFVVGLFLLYYMVFAKFNIKKIIIYCCAAFVIYYINNNYAISEYDADEKKSSETIEYWGASLSELESANLSTYSLLKNFKIATMADNRITGTGLGSHGHSHDKFYHSNAWFAELNKNDAFSLGTRIFSELGIIGLIAFILFFWKGFNKNNYINVSIIFYIIYAFCRGGHYTIFGLQFFIMLFYFTSKYKIN